MRKMLKRLPPVQTALAILFLLVQTGASLYLPYLTAGIVNQGIAAGNLPYIWQQGGIMLLFSALSLGGALLNMYLSGKIAYGIGKSLRDEVFGKVLAFSRTEYDQFGTSGLITRNISDVTQVQTVIEMLLKFLILSPAYMIGGIYLTYRLNPALTVPFLVIIPFMAIAAVVIYRFATPLYTRMQRLLDRLNLLFREGITGVRVIRAFCQEEQDADKYRETNQDFTKTSITAGTIMSVFLPLITLILSIATLGVVWIGGQSAASGAADVGSIMAAVTYGAQILTGFSLLTNAILTLPRGQVSAKRIQEVLDTPLSIEDSTQPRFPRHPELVFDHVDFRYAGAARKTLDDISFSVQGGQTLAIIGSTGDGKTSLLNLISRLYDTEKGSVRISGVDVRDMMQEVVRQHVSLTPQKSALLMGTIRSNLLLAKPNATDEDMWSALDCACASEFVRQLPEGLDSPVEKNGANFSGGQRQRLCIARTLLKDADIYLFDDSFSALDFKTDAAVRANIRKRLHGKVVVIVAQRISTIAGADQIAILDKGRLAGLGTHTALLAHNEVYQEIVRSQSDEEVAA